MSQGGTFVPDECYIDIALPFVDVAGADVDVAATDVDVCSSGGPLRAYGANVAKCCIHVALAAVRAILTAMADVDRAVQASQRLLALKERKKELEKELAQVDAGIREVMGDLAVATGGLPDTPYTGGYDSLNVMTLLRRNPDQVFSPSDVAQRLGITDKREYRNLRLLLTRMARDGRCERPGYGRYRAKR